MRKSERKEYMFMTIQEGFKKKAVQIDGAFLN